MNIENAVLIMGKSLPAPMISKPMLVQPLMRPPPLFVRRSPTFMLKSNRAIMAVGSLPPKRLKAHAFSILDQDRGRTPIFWRN